MPEPSRLKPKVYGLWDRVAHQMVSAESLVFHGSDLRIANGFSENRFIVLEWTTMTDTSGERIFEADFIRLEAGIALVHWIGSGWNISRESKGLIVGNYFQNPDLR